MFFEQKNFILKRLFLTKQKLTSEWICSSILKLKLCSKIHQQQWRDPRLHGWFDVRPPLNHHRPRMRTSRNVADGWIWWTKSTAGTSFHFHTWNRLWLVPYTHVIVYYLFPSCCWILKRTLTKFQEGFCDAWAETDWTPEESSKKDYIYSEEVFI